MISVNDIRNTMLGQIVISKLSTPAVAATYPTSKAVVRRDLAVGVLFSNYVCKMTTGFRKLMSGLSQLTFLDNILDSVQ
jgi:hypothetical protein